MNIYKRIFDICLAVVLVVIFSPVMLAIAAAMKLTSPGPIIFRQERVGKGGRVFMINKFRKFPADWGKKGPGVTLQGDSRMTNIGEFLERTKLDEVPQLWNILVGEMSFVGPRPESLAFSHLVTARYEELYNYTPGLFGPNQVRFRNESAMYPKGRDPIEYYETHLFPTKAEADIDYFKTANMLSDIGWILKGAFSLLFNVVISKRSLLQHLVLVCSDMIALCVAWVCAFWLKYSVAGTATYSAHHAGNLEKGLFVLPLMMLAVFLLVRVYRHPVRYFSETDALRLIGATSTVWIASAITLSFIGTRVTGLVLAVACLTSICLLVLPRAACSWYYNQLESRRVRAKNLDKVNALVCGLSPQSLEMASMLDRGFEKARVVGLVDNDRAMIRREARGFVVLGTYEDLDVVHQRFHIDQIWYGSSTSAEDQALVRDWCLTNRAEAVALTALPGFRKLAKSSSPAEGKVEVTRAKSESKAEVAV